MLQPTSFRAARRLRLANLLLQAALLLTFFAGLNYLALRYAWRHDLSLTRSRTLSAETLSYLQQLTQPIRIISTLPTESSEPAIAETAKEIQTLLRTYVQATESRPQARITFENLNVFERPKDAKALKLEGQENTIVVICGPNIRHIPLSDLYLFEKDQKKAFLGEQAVTAAILDVANPKRKKIYFLTGHGEMDPEGVDPNRGLSLLLSEIRARNFDVDRLELNLSKKIPDDPDHAPSLLIIAGPTNRYDPREEELLRQYLSNRAGRLLLLLAPGYAHGLDNLLFDWGVRSEDVVLFDNGPAGQNETGDLILSADAYAPKHPITQPLINYQLSLQFGLARSVRINLSNTTSGLIATTLITPAKSAWGETRYRQSPVIYNLGYDIPGDSLGLAVASERATAKGNLPFSVAGGRLVTIGCADFAANKRLGALGNLQLTLASINWLVDRDTQLSIPARPIQRLQLTLSREQTSHLRYAIFFALPLAAAILGFIVYWTRRR